MITIRYPLSPTIFFVIRFDSNLPASCVPGCPNRSIRIPQFHRHHVVERSCWTAGPKRPCPGTVQQISTESQNIFKSRNILNLVGSMVKTLEMRPFNSSVLLFRAEKRWNLKTFSNIFNTSLHTNSICSKEYSGFHSWTQKQEGVCWQWTHWTLGVILRRNTWRLFTSFQMLLLRLLLAPPPPPRTPPLDVLSWFLIIAKQSRYSYLFEYYLYGQKHQETDFSVATSKRHAKNKPCLATCFVHFDLYGPAPSDESHPRWSRPWLAPQTSPGWSRPSLRVHGPDRTTAVPPSRPHSDLNVFHERLRIQDFGWIREGKARSQAAKTDRPEQTSRFWLKGSSQVKLNFECHLDGAEDMRVD